jgi:hypothetical protein
MLETASALPSFIVSSSVGPAKQGLSGSGRVLLEALWLRLHCPFWVPFQYPHRRSHTDREETSGSNHLRRHGCLLCRENAESDTLGSWRRWSIRVSCPIPRSIFRD